MRQTETIQALGVPVETFAVRTLVIGTGAAGYNAALRLSQLGHEVAMLTEGVNAGTSRNTGSDKQTYYKLTLCGDTPDAVADMAADLFAGGCVDGDHALIEAALSPRCFMNLCELGVAFPTNRFGEYVGYKTDHDPRARATSAGPLTSREMTRCLQAEVERRGVPVLDRCQAIALLEDRGRACGVLALRLNHLAEEARRFVAISAEQVVLATGGPAGIYADTVYPLGHHGASGLALEAGALGKNLTEWQYGLASISPRWNVSGTYMQSLPSFVSVDDAGGEHFFLEDFFPDASSCLSRVFRKGYEWPFDSCKAGEGSSLMDLLVHRERAILGRRVYLDFRRNPYGRFPDFSALDEEARTYLSKAGGDFGLPIERLAHMNAPAVELYRSKGVDLSRQRLEIALCAQHHNGGLEVDGWWQTTLPGLYAIGEAAGTHGVYRPGGSALNAGQVGGLRAAQHIARRSGREPEGAAPWPRLLPHIASKVELCRRLLESGEENTEEPGATMRRRMSEVAGPLRDPSKMRELLEEVENLWKDFDRRVRARPEGLGECFRLRESLVAQRAVLAAMLDYSEEGGASRGSAIYLNPLGKAPMGLDQSFAFLGEGEKRLGEVQRTALCKDETKVTWRPVRPIPKEDEAFETVWRGFREDGNVR